MVDWIVRLMLSRIGTDAMITELNHRNAYPVISTFDDDEIRAAFEDRGLKARPEDDDPVEHTGDLNEAIDRAQDGDIGLCGHYLIRAIPGLWPLGKILGA